MDTPVCDLHKLADFDAAKLPKMEKSGERLLRDVKEWTLQELTSKECTVLPEDKLQRIMVGVMTFSLLFFLFSNYTITIEVIHFQHSYFLNFRLAINWRLPVISSRQPST